MIPLKLKSEIAAFDATNTQETLLKKHMGDGAILNWAHMTSSERVQDIETPTTVGGKCAT